MVKIPNMLEENEDYELIPADGEQWHVRLLKGDLIETIISFNQIKVDESMDQLKFDFNVEFSPDDSITAENLDLQKAAGKVLESIIMYNLENMENK